jgi:NAD(P)-dependent dehydrogenase (short-subunit alcohol dehydrogenase family)
MTFPVLEGKVAIVTGAAMGMGEATFGRLDIAVNNAALTPDDKLVSEFDEDYWDRLMSVDLKGTALSMKYELRQLLAQGGGGSIINISSVSGFRPQPNNIAYVAAKHGVVGMTKVAAMENGPHNIRVNSVAPGAVDTPMLRGALEQFGFSEEEYAPQLSLLNRFGQPGEIAQASLWLASDASSYVTGTTLHVDAGYTSR